MYDSDYFFVKNPIDRYALGTRNPLKENADGSVDVYIQKDSPGKDRESNWLPAPEGEFVLMLRMYWPRMTPPSIIDGSWKVPGVVRAPATQDETPAKKPAAVAKEKAGPEKVGPPTAAPEKIAPPAAVPAPPVTPPMGVVPYNPDARQRLFPRLFRWRNR